MFSLRKLEGFSALLGDSTSLVQRQALDVLLLLFPLRLLETPAPPAPTERMPYNMYTINSITDS